MNTRRRRPTKRSTTQVTKPSSKTAKKKTPNFVGESYRGGSKDFYTRFPTKGGPAPFKPGKSKPTKGKSKDTPKRPLRPGDKMDPRNKPTKGKSKGLNIDFSGTKKKAVTTSTKKPTKKGKDGTRITGATAGPRPRPTKGPDGKPKSPTRTIKGPGGTKMSPPSGRGGKVKKGGKTMYSRGRR